MIHLKATLAPQTAFATLLQGDTLFGQLCWTIRHGWGEARLVELLEGYIGGRPFLVVSDAFPLAHLPLPALPSRAWDGLPADPRKRKAIKRRVWVPETLLDQPLESWQRQAHDEAGVAGSLRLKGGKITANQPQPRNSLNRLTLATGKGDGFSPYTVRQHWFAPGVLVDVHLRLDEGRLPRADLQAALAAIGAAGYGKDANVGLGKFILEALADHPLPVCTDPDAWLSLANCAPQGLGFDAARSFYRPFTRYGRHGDEAARRESPFKSPLLLAAAGAVFAAPAEVDWAHGFIGQGLGGDGSISRTLPATVHQAYAPALPVRLPTALRQAEAA